MMLQHKPEQQWIEEALIHGRLSVPDEHGFHHGFYAICPSDGSRAHPARSVWRRDARGHYIDQVVMRCDSCRRDWHAALDELHLA